MTRGLNDSWTDERIAQLEKLWGEGQSSGQISRAMGTTRNAVIGKCTRLGLVGRKPSRPIKQPKFSVAAREELERKRDRQDLDILDALVRGADPAVVAANRKVNVSYVQNLLREREAAA